MDKQKNITVLVSTILVCICALVWNIHVIVDFAYGYPNVLRILCTIAWDICAVVWVFRYLKSRKDTEGD